MQRPMSLNGYLYVYGDPVNNTDASGMCPRLDGGMEARECELLRQDLRGWGVNIVYDIGRDVLEPSSSCLPEQCEQAINQAQGVRQRFTFGEMSAIHSAFRIFKTARSDIGFERLYAFPLSEAIYIEKKQQAGIVDNDQRSALGLTTGRTITLSATLWGEGTQTAGSIDTFISNIRFADQSNPSLNAQQYRSWLVLHEFGHVFTTDLKVDYVALYGQVPPIYLQYAPTRYAVSANDEKEFIIEALTGTWWNYGYASVSGYTSDAGGRTSSIDADFSTPETRFEYDVRGTIVTNVRNPFLVEAFSQVNETLENFIIRSILSS